MADDANPTVPVVTLHTGVTDEAFKTGRWAIALTTVFTPPAGCSWPISDTFNRPTSCFPPYFDRAGPAYLGYYSPGICPSGYTVGCTPDTAIRTFNDEPIKSGETVGVCVPVYVLVSSAVLRAMWRSELTSSRSFSCRGTASLTTGVMAVSTYTVGTTRTSAEARIVHIRWQSSDLSLFETPPLPGISVSRTPPSAESRSGTGAPAASTGGQSEAASNSSSAALSGGAIAGIVIGVVLAAILGALFAFRFMRARLKAGRTSWPDGADSGEKPELEDTARTGPAASAVMDRRTGGDAVELNGELQPTWELPGRLIQRPVELGS